MVYDLIVVGGGLAGMTAALYALRAGKHVLVIEKSGFGGQITHSPKVENYPGTLSMSGNELADKTLEQILAQGAEIELEEVEKIETAEDSPVKTVLAKEGSRFEAYTIVLATGVKHRMLGLPGENELVGDGISFCAVCDGDFYTGQTVCVAGGGNSALQEAILLAEKCKEVIMLQDLPFFTGEQKLQDVLFSRENVRSYTQVGVTGLKTNENGFCGVEITHTDSPEKKTEVIPCDGLFVAIGLIPENDAFAGLAQLDERGYFDADERCLTGTPGVYVAGDCRSKNVRQLTTAVADGATAAIAACRYLNEMQA